MNTTFTGFTTFPSPPWPKCHPEQGRRVGELRSCTRQVEGVAGRSRSIYRQHRRPTVGKAVEAVFPGEVPAENPRSCMHRTALFSPCRTFRYRLGRRWSDGPVLAFIMLNPSCADEQVDDPSVRRCIGFSQRLGYGGLEVVNLYAFLATDPAELRRAGYPVGPGNDQQITEAVHESSRVVAAWGVHAARLGRPKEVLGLLNTLGATPYCLRVTTSGHPEHPLRLPSSCELRPYQQ